MDSPADQSTYTAEFLAEDISGRLLGVAIAFVIINIMFGILRLIAQRFKGRPFGLDDLFSYISLILNLGQCAAAISLGLQKLNTATDTVIAMIPVAGLGRHLAYVRQNRPDQIVHLWPLIFSNQILYIFSFTFPKLCIVFLYLKIFTSRFARGICHIVSGVVVMTFIASLFSAIFQCSPVRKAWRPMEPGQCVDQLTMYQYWSLPNMVTDIVMLILPIPTVWKLHLPKKQKLALGFIFFLGSIGLVASIVRFVTFARDAAANSLILDTTWASLELEIWTIVEPSLYFVAGILPTLRPLGALFYKKMKTINSKHSRNRHNDKSKETIQLDAKETSSSRSIQSDYSHGLPNNKMKVRESDRKKSRNIGITRTDEVLVEHETA